MGNFSTVQVDLHNLQKCKQNADWLSSKIFHKLMANELLLDFWILIFPKYMWLDLAYRERDIGTSKNIKKPWSKNSWNEFIRFHEIFFYFWFSETRVISRKNTQKKIFFMWNWITVRTPIMDPFPIENPSLKIQIEDPYLFSKKWVLGALY